MAEVYVAECTLTTTATGVVFGSNSQHTTLKGICFQQGRVKGSIYVTAERPKPVLWSLWGQEEYIVQQAGTQTQIKIYLSTCFLSKNFILKGHKS